MSNACKGARYCAVGIAGCAKGCELVQAPKACCWAKECACCETCKAAKGQKTVQIERVMIEPMPCPGLPGYRVLGGLPMAGRDLEDRAAARRAVWMMPMVSQNVLRFGQSRAPRPAKLVTPDFEAHWAIA